MSLPEGLKPVFVTKVRPLLDMYGFPKLKKSEVTPFQSFKDIKVLPETRSKAYIGTKEYITFQLSPKGWVLCVPGFYEEKETSIEYLIRMIREVRLWTRHAKNWGEAEKYKLQLKALEAAYPVGKTTIATPSDFRATLDAAYVESLKALQRHIEALNYINGGEDAPPTPEDIQGYVASGVALVQKVAPELKWP